MAEDKETKAPAEQEQGEKKEFKATRDIQDDADGNPFAKKD